MRFGVIALQKETGRKLLALGFGGGHAFLEAIAFTRQGDLDQRRQRSLLQGAADFVIPLFQFLSLACGTQANVARRPQLSPALETNLQKIGVHRGGRFDSYHAVGEAAALSIRPWTVKIASCVTGRPNTFRAVLAPGQYRTGLDPAAKFFERPQHVRRNLRRTLDYVIGFCFVHA